MEIFQFYQRMTLNQKLKLIKKYKIKYLKEKLYLSECNDKDSGNYQYLYYAPKESSIQVYDPFLNINTILISTN